MKKFAIIISFFLLWNIQNAFAQSEMKEAHTKEINSYLNTSGKGKGTFKTSLKQLEYIISNKYTKEQIQSLFPEWTIVDRALSYVYNKETNNHDIPQFMLQYNLQFSNEEYFWVNIVINKDLSNKIHSIKLIGITEQTYNNLISESINSNYVYKYGNYTGVSYENKTKRMVLKPYVSEDYVYTMKIYNY